MTDDNRHRAISNLNIDTHTVKPGMSVLNCLRGFFDSGLCSMITNTIACVRSNRSTEAGQPNTPPHPINVSDASRADEPDLFNRYADRNELFGVEEAISLSDSSSWVTVESESVALSARIHEWLDDVAPGEISYHFAHEVPWIACHFTREIKIAG
ncbi:hypothetical protein FGRMN_6146 [Fusarium graminum]|nr:hypothetical protein FGRMN_6146 [Fusarium graminum]